MIFKKSPATLSSADSVVFFTGKLFFNLEMSLPGAIFYSSNKNLNKKFFHKGKLQKNAAIIVGNYITDIFGKELKPWQNEENPAKV